MRLSIFLKALLLALLVACSFTGRLQAQVSGFEYFFDADPGFGNGVQVNTGFTPGASVNFNLNVAATGLVPGFHQLFIRAKAANGIWGFSQLQPVYVTAFSAGNGAIAAAECFYDIDPGVGQGTAMPLAAGALINQTVVLPVTGLSSGFHQLYLRVKNTNGTWGHYQYRTVFITTVANGNGNIAGAEYFFDADPGKGQGTAVALNAGATVDQNVLIPVGNLSAGFHQLYLRTRNTSNTWSHYQTRSFMVTSAANVHRKIMAAEYFIDSDPGVGSATPISINPPNDLINQTFTFPINGNPSEGMHRIVVRVKNEQGQWSHFQTQEFAVKGSRPGSGFAAGFDGNDDYAEAAFSVAGQANNFTCELWVNPGTSTIQLATPSNSGTAGASGQHYVIYPQYGGANNAAIGLSVGANGVQVVEHGLNYLPVVLSWNHTLNGWTHLAVVYNNKQPALYVNGVLVATGTASNRDSVFLAIDKMTTFGGGFYGKYEGKVDELRVWNTSLSVTEIRDWMCRKLGPAHTQFNNLVSSFNLDEGNGSNAFDDFYGGKLSFINGPAFEVSGAPIGNASAHNYLGAAAGTTLAHPTRGDAITATLTSGAADGIQLYCVTDTPNNKAGTTCLGDNNGYFGVFTVNGTNPVYNASYNYTGIGMTGFNEAQIKVYARDNNSVASWGDAMATLDTVVNTASGTNLASSEFILSNAVVSPTINITANPATPVCNGTPVTFTAVILNGGTNPVFQWKKNGLNVGSNASTYTDNNLANGDSITCALTSNSTCVSPAVAVSSAFRAAVSNGLSASVSIAATPGNTICAGTQVMFTATPANGGLAPVYQWKINGLAVGGNASTYTATSFAEGDIVTCDMSTNATCAGPALVTSAVVTMHVNPVVAPGISIAAPGGINVCSGTTVVFTAAITNGGTNPSYQWKKNGNPVGGNAAAYSDNNFNNGDVVVCELHSDARCASPSIIQNAPLTLSVNSSAAPTINISASANTVCTGAAVTFNALVTNGGATPVYQWKKNGVNTGSNGPAYTDNQLLSSDTITCILTSSSSCVMSSSAISNKLGIAVYPIVSPSVTIVVSPSNTICAGTAATFTATPINGGAAPGFQWKLNGLPVGINSASFTSSSLVANDVITCEVTSGLPCTTQPTAVSNSVAMNVNALPLANAGSDQTILRGSSVLLTATGGGNYLWSNGDTTNSIVVSPSNTTTYVVAVNNAQGCTATDTVLVTVNFSSLGISASTSDFGDVVVNSTAVTDITITNNGTLPETISGASISAPFATNIAAQTIAPNTTIHIPVSLTPPALLIYQQTLSIQTSTGLFNVVMRGRGVNAAPSWTITPASFDFGNVPVSDSMSHTFVIANTGNVPLTINNIQSSQAAFTAHTLASIIPVGGQASLFVKLKPLAITGYSGVVTVGSTAGGLTPLGLNVSGNGYIPGARPVLGFIVVAPYNGTSGVDRIVAPASVFNYRVQYKHINNIAPMAGYPKVGIDLNADGDFIDAGEGVYSMSKVGTTTDWMNGEAYTFAYQLPIGNTYGYRFFANDSLGNNAIAVHTNYVAGPQVTNQGLDLSIYANDITFSNNNPVVGQQFTVSAIVHNNSPYSASNVPVRFYKDSVFLTSTTLPFIGANTTATVTQHFSFAPDGFYPIKVWIDSANTLGENNPLNNYAIRPVIVGNFSIPGTIHITSAANTQSCPEAAVSISGTATYSGLNLVGNPPVLGATVTVQILNGPTLTTNTVSGGNWSVYYSGFGCGNIKSYTVTVTDYTLTNSTALASFIAPCQSCGSGGGNGVAVLFNQGTPTGCMKENTAFNYSISYVNNCNHDTLRNDTTYVYADNILAFTHTNPIIHPCITTSYNDAFTLPAGNHVLSYLNVHYDSSGRQQSTNSTTVNVELNLPDLSLGNFAQTGSTAFSVRDINGVCVDAGAHKVLLYDSLAGNVRTLIDSFTVTNIGGQAFQVWNYTNPMLQMGYHYLKLVTDAHATVVERNEVNNELEALLYVPFPELTISDIVASTSGLTTGSTINFSANIHNAGSSAGAFKVRFLAGGLPVGNLITVAGLSSHTTIPVVSDTYTIPSGGCPVIITAIVDAANEVNELLETNNTDSINLATDLVSGVSCYGLGSSCNPYIIPKNFIHHFATIVRNIGTRDAGVQVVKFTLAGAIIGSDHVAAITAQSVANAGLDYAFASAGNYMIHVMADSGNAICEADESNNNGAVYVNVVEGLPDLEILSQHISPSNLNPNPNQTISIVASVFNHGTQRSNPAVVRFMVDNVQLGADVAIDSIYPGRDTTVMATASYSSPTVGPKIIKIIADAANDNLELRENNNEATRAIIVGGAPDFAHSKNEAITFSKTQFRKGQTIAIRNYIRNYGGDQGTAWLRYCLSDDAGVRTLLDSVQFTLQSNDSMVVSKNWLVNIVGHGRVTTEIAYSNPQEFNEFNNVDSLDFIAGPELNITSLNAVSDVICDGSMLNIGYSILKGGQPLTYEWYHNNLSTGNTSGLAYLISNATLTDSGKYELRVTDSFGTEKSPVKSIVVHPVLVPAVSIIARPGNVICKGNWVKFIAAPMNGGTAPMYQWKKNGVVIPAATKAIFIDSLVNHGDELTCTMISNAPCTATSPVMSNAIQMTVNGLSNTLAAGNASQTNDNDSGMYFNYTDNNCKLIATVSTDSLQDLGITTATTTIDAVFNGFVSRSVEITPANNGPARVKLYFQQSEFTGYNNAVGVGQAQLPVSASDPAMNNIVVYQYHGLPSSGTTGPGGRYNAGNVSLIQSADITKQWNALSGYWEISFPVNGFSGHFLKAQNAAPLSVALGSIAATNKGAINEVYWETLQETSGGYFELERSANAKDFRKVARINGNGQPSPYTYMDNEPMSGINYYRLRMIEASGRFGYSKTVSAIARAGVFSIDAFPNPAKSVINVTIHSGAFNGSLQLTDIAGNVLTRIPVNGNQQTFDLNEFAAGIYFVKYTDDLHHQTIRIVKE